MSVDTWQAHGANVLLRMLPEDDEAGGVEIPDVAQDRPKRGVVVHPGTGIIDADGNNVPSGVEENDTVLVSKFGGTDIIAGGIKYRVVKAEDIICTL